MVCGWLGGFMVGLVSLLLCSFGVGSVSSR